jgi:hypothetical protein
MNISPSFLRRDLKNHRQIGPHFAVDIGTFAWYKAGL